jgi:hypothetical protein
VRIGSFTVDEIAAFPRRFRGAARFVSEQTLLSNKRATSVCEEKTILNATFLGQPYVFDLSQSTREVTETARNDRTSCGRFTSEGGRGICKQNWLRPSSGKSGIAMGERNQFWDRNV